MRSRSKAGSQSPFLGAYPHDLGTSQSFHPVLTGCHPQGTRLSSQWTLGGHQPNSNHGCAFKTSRSLDYHLWPGGGSCPIAVASRNDSAFGGVRQMDRVPHLLSPKDRSSEAVSPSRGSRAAQASRAPRDFPQAPRGGGELELVTFSPSEASVLPGSFSSLQLILPGPAFLSKDSDLPKS